jgi:hypothetical protein
LTVRELDGRIEEFVSPTTEVEWDLEADPPAVLLRSQRTGLLLRIEDLGGELLASVSGCEIEGTLAPDEARVIEVASQFGRNRLVAVRSFIGSVPIGSWLELGGEPLVYGGKNTLFDNALARLPGYREARVDL